MAMVLNNWNYLLALGSKYSIAVACLHDLCYVMIFLQQINMEQFKSFNFFHLSSLAYHFFQLQYRGHSREVAAHSSAATSALSPRLNWLSLDLKSKQAIYQLLLQCHFGQQSQHIQHISLVTRLHIDGCSFHNVKCCELSTDLQGHFQVLLLNAHTADQRWRILFYY